MSGPREELSQVKEELGQVEEQLEALLDRQSRLIQKKSDLEELIRDEAKRERDTAATDWEREDFQWSKKLTDTMKNVFRIPRFRPLQLKTMNVTLSGKDCILIMPTGGGKSLCFQLPALVSKGITLVVSPLVSLMEDQILALEKLNITAVKLSASSSKEHVKYVQDNMTNQKCPYKMLYVTPEKLAKSKRFMGKLEKMYDAGLFSRIVIDEVHCCSQWGHDFRPDYKFLGVLRRQFPGVPILGLTATATSNVLQDVKKILGVHDCVVYRASFNRRNLFYEVRIKPSGLEATLNEMYKLINSRFKGQSGIVYCLTQKDTEQVSKELQKRGVKSGCYHANLDPQYRSKVHTQWINNEIQVVVATIAFGMGIDKPDVRFVIHHSISKSMENYYQESGRAGRDDRRSYCIVYVGFTDVARQSTMVFTEQTGLDKLYNMVEYAFDVSRCRRTLIARHFGERWNAADCDMMCDHCNRSAGDAGFANKDVTSLCRDVITILNQAKTKEQRVTALKLLESVMGRGAAILRVKTVAPPTLTEHNVERVLMFMLLKGYLREDFHFTAYTTISYLLPGPSSSLLMSPDHKVSLDLEDTKPTGKTKKSRSSSSSKSDKSSKSAGQKTPVFVNVENSSFIKGGQGVKSGNEQSNSTDKTGKHLLRKSGSVSKRKVVISDDDKSNTGDLDFGDVGDVPISKKQKLRLRERKNRDCILIEDSDEDFDPQPGTSSNGKSVVNKSSRIKSGNSKKRSDDSPSSVHSSSSEDIHDVYTKQLESLKGSLDNSNGVFNSSNGGLERSGAMQECIDDSD